MLDDFLFVSTLIFSSETLSWPLTVLRRVNLCFAFCLFESFYIWVYEERDSVKVVFLCSG